MLVCILLHELVYLPLNRSRIIHLTIRGLRELFYSNLHLFPIRVSLFTEPDYRDAASKKHYEKSVGMFYLLSKDLDSFVAFGESLAENGLFFLSEPHFFLIILVDLFIATLITDD